MTGSLIVSIDTVPADLTSFVALQEALAQTPEGGVATFLLALLIRRTDGALGGKCLAASVDAYAGDLGGLIERMAQIFDDDDKNLLYLATELRAIQNDLELAKQKYPKRWVTRRRDASLVLFLLHTGLRLSEATELRLDDVQLSERKGSVSVQNGKGNKQRSVPLNSDARKALQAWLEVRPQGDHLWMTVEGEHEILSGRTVQRILQR